MSLTLFDDSPKELTLIALSIYISVLWRLITYSNKKMKMTWCKYNTV